MEMKETMMKVGNLFREFLLDRKCIDEKKRTVELSFSSETDQVERSFGVEILDHSSDAVDLTRLKRSGALLIDHDARNQVGVIEEVTIGADRKGRAVVRFGRSAKAEEIFQDVIDGIRRSVSCGYEPRDMKFERSQTGGPDVYRVTKWAPFEISLVSIPADISVGVGREMQQREIRVAVPELNPIQEEQKMSTETTPVVAPAAAEVRVAVAPQAIDMEKGRRQSIENLAKTNKIDDNIRDMWINQGATLNQVSDDLIKIMEERGRLNPQSAAKLGLTADETKKFSIVRAIRAVVEKDWTHAGFELECSRAIASKLQRVPDANRVFVPFEVLQRPIGTRDLSSTSGGVGGYLVQTDNVGFIELLRNRSVVMNMGARTLSGLVGNVTIPSMSVGASATWLANQASQIDEQTQTFIQVALSPKNVGAYTEISRQLMMQSSPGVESIVSDDLAKSVATAADYACLAGAGTSGEPDGIIGYAGVGSVTGTSLAYAGVLNFQEDVASSNVIPVRGGYVTTPAVASLMMQRVKYTSTASPLWEGNLWDGSMCGFKAMSSNQVPTADMIFGDWSEMVIGEWGVLEIEVNPFANFQAGIIGVRAIYSMDVAHRRPAAFSIATSIT